jgi:hypothetical protein
VGSRSALLASCLGLALLPTSCALFARGASPDTLVAVRYDVRAESLEPCVLDVDVTLAAGAESLAAEVPGVVLTDAWVDEGRGRRAVRLEAGRLRLGCASACRAHYRLDLSATARAHDDSVEIALRAGRDVLAPASTWLLHPSPWRPDLPVELTVRTAGGVRFVSGLRRARRDDTYELRSQDVLTAGYAAFGEVHATAVPVHGGSIDVTVLSGARALDDAALERWVGATAGYLDAVYGRFPVPHAQVFIVPETGSDDVDFGRTLPAGGPTTVVFVGARADEAALARDWILTHELFHLGVPSFFEEGRWLDEGLATYYEPVLRARAGVLTDRALWRQFASEMPRGLPHGGEPGLAQATGHDRVYWGGAIFALRADVEIRRRTSGSRSLDDGLRAVIAQGGDATRVWTLERFLGAVDEGTGVAVTRELFASIRPRAGADEALGFSATMRELGVACAADDGISLLDDAPLATARRGIAATRLALRKDRPPVDPAK